MYHLVSYVANVKGYAYIWGQGLYEKSLHLPLNFAVNLKLLLKTKNFLE